MHALTLMSQTDHGLSAQDARTTYSGLDTKEKQEVMDAYQSA